MAWEHRGGSNSKEQMLGDRSGVMFFERRRHVGWGERVLSGDRGANTYGPYKLAGPPH
jgi:hypothetical protein